ncbi:MAG: PEP/pyruvate-binding domain-containing protein, partial [Pirellulaceae bacterium]
EATDGAEDVVGGKAAKLAALLRAGFTVPHGFCITTRAYEQFVAETGLATCVAMELGRKSLDHARWEELWDAALRIRSEFLRAEIPASISAEICRALAEHVGDSAVAVRSSAPGEDSRHVSFAGLHESIVGVQGGRAVLDAVRTVWASLWSDAALLYRRELALDPRRSRMAVLVQEMKLADCSGVAFARDPRDPEADLAVVEAVPGRCALLVDGAVDPDRWTLKRSSGELLEWRPGNRGQETQEPLLDQVDLAHLLGTLQRVEDLFAWPPDIEWTGRAAALVVLQARPITTTKPDAEDERTWYLSLRPGVRRLTDLAKRVTEELIPELESAGARFAAEELRQYDDAQLATAIQERLDSLRRWKEIYWDEFIPFAHGVRCLAQYYNDAVRPVDPYEFVGLLKSEDMLASRRNRAMASLAVRLRANRQLKDAVTDALGALAAADTTAWRQTLKPVLSLPHGSEFFEELNALMTEFMDVTYGAERLLDRPDLLLHTLLELAADADHGAEPSHAHPGLSRGELERCFFEAVGPTRREEATEVLRIGRVSWRLRDDDNLLLSRVESQLLRAVDLGLDRLREAGRLRGEPRRNQEAISVIVAALRDDSHMPLEFPAGQPEESPPRSPAQETPRQLIGQPASPGLASGKVRRITVADDIQGFRAGEVLVCDAIQPMMTHLVPLAAAIVERRGGMLIHGAIIAREMGIPCVNGVVRAVELLTNGDLVTVDGHLGIVTVGPPEFNLELA